LAEKFPVKILFLLSLIDYSIRAEIHFTPAGKEEDLEEG